MKKLDPFWLFPVVLLLAMLYFLRGDAGASATEQLFYLFLAAATGVLAFVAMMSRHKRDGKPQISFPRALRVGMASLGAAMGVLILLAVVTTGIIFDAHVGLLWLGLALGLSPLIERHLE